MKNRLRKTIFLLSLLLNSCLALAFPAHLIQKMSCLGQSIDALLLQKVSVDINVTQTEKRGFDTAAMNGIALSPSELLIPENRTRITVHSRVHNPFPLDLLNFEENRLQIAALHKMEPDLFIYLLNFSNTPSYLAGKELWIPGKSGPDLKCVKFALSSFPDDTTLELKVDAGVSFEPHDFAPVFVELGSNRHLVGVIVSKGFSQGKKVWRMLRLDAKKALTVQNLIIQNALGQLTFSTAWGHSSDSGRFRIEISKTPQGLQDDLKIINQTPLSPTEVLEVDPSIGGADLSSSGSTRYIEGKPYLLKETNTLQVRLFDQEIPALKIHSLGTPCMTAALKERFRFNNPSQLENRELYFPIRKKSTGQSVFVKLILKEIDFGHLLKFRAGTDFPDIEFSGSYPLYLLEKNQYKLIGIIAGNSAFFSIVWLAMPIATVIDNIIIRHALGQPASAQSITVPNIFVEGQKGISAKEQQNDDLMRDRALGSFLGMAIGDAIGTTLEFRARDTYTHLTDIVGGGPFHLQAGMFTDDTSMGLCLAESLIEQGEFNPKDLMDRFSRWRNEGYNSVTGTCFDIGIATSSAIHAYASSHNPYSGSTHDSSSGNGSIMRLAPVPIRYHRNLSKALEVARMQSRTTHGSLKCLDSCALMTRIIIDAIYGKSKSEILAAAGIVLTEPVVKELVSPHASWKTKTRNQIFSSGYVIHTLEAAIWCVATTNSFEEAVLKAVNLGNDADTVGAVTGQIAGALYGKSGIPKRWLDKLYWRAKIEDYANKLFDRDS